MIKIATSGMLPAARCCLLPSALGALLQWFGSMPQI